MTKDTATVNATPMGISSSTSSSEPALSITCFDNEIPPFVEPALNNLYGSMFSSLARFRVYGGIENASTYVVRNKQDIVTIFLFRREGANIHVLNEGIPIDEASATRFADYIFGRYRQVDMISFNAVETTIKRLDYPYTQFNCTEDSVVKLPATPDAYLNNFGKSSRRNLKYYLNRLKRDHPSFTYRVYGKDEVDEHLVRGIIQFNRQRFANKNKVSSISAAEENRIVRMVRECGMVGVATIDGQLCAGSITYCFGDHYYSWLKAHDPKYDDYRFGVILSYLMICECIKRGGKTFHFLWGRQPQKALLQGEHRDQAHLTIFRSRFAVIRHANVTVRHTYRYLMRHAKLYLLELERKEGTAAEAARTLFAYVRKIKGKLAGRH